MLSLHPTARAHSGPHLLRLVTGRPSEGALGLSTTQIRVPTHEVRNARNATFGACSRAALVPLSTPGAFGGHGHHVGCLCDPLGTFPRQSHGSTRERAVAGYPPASPPSRFFLILLYYTTRLHSKKTRSGSRGVPEGFPTSRSGRTREGLPGSGTVLWLDLIRK